MLPSLVALAGLAVAFLASHFVMSHLPVRSALIARWGEGPFLGAYTAVSLGTYLPMAALWWTHRHTGPALWLLRSPTTLRLTEIVVAAGVAMSVGALVQPAPSSAASRPRETVEVRGLAHVTRHPLFWGLSLIAGGHLLTNGWASDVVFLGSHVVLGVVGALHQDRRLRETKTGYAAFAERTTFLPNPLGLVRIGGRAATGLAAGLVLAVALRYAHRWF